jgi:Na+/H+-dicarboxylate symporter
MNTTTLTCMFGEVLVPASYISDGDLSCIVPSTHKEGVDLEIGGPATVMVKVSNNGIDFSPLGMVFTFVQSVDVQKVYIHIHVYTYIYIFIYTHIYMYIYVYIYIYIFTYIYIYTYI